MSQPSSWAPETWKINDPMILLHIYKSEYKFREFFLYISKSDYSRYLTIHIHLQMCDYSTSFIDFFLFFWTKLDDFPLIPYAWFISGLFVWWAWSTKHASDPWDQKQLQNERSPGSRIYSMLPSQTLRGRPKALMHVTVLTHSSSQDSIHRQLKREGKNLQIISLPHKHSLVRLGDLLFQHRTRSLNDRPQTLLLNYKYTQTHSLLATCLWTGKYLRLTRTKYPEL